VGEAAATDTQARATRRRGLRDVFASLLELLHTRIDLLGTELREELLRLLLLLAGLCVVLLAMTLGAGLLAAALVLALWEAHPLLGLSVAGLSFVCVGLLALWMLSRVARAKARPFEASLEQLRRDSDALRTRP